MPVIIHPILPLSQQHRVKRHILTLLLNADLEVVGGEGRGALFQVEADVLAAQLVEVQGFVVAGPLVDVGGWVSGFD
jgi:hypothetical protein